MSRAPLVSVIVPNYNHGRFLPERLRSIIAQTFQDFELILLDDASTDNSPAVLGSCKSDKPTILIFNTRNSGSPFIQWNRGINAASGELIWIAESDDSSEATLLGRLVSKFQTNSSCVLAYCQSRTVDENGVAIGLAAYSRHGTTDQFWTSDHLFTSEDLELWHSLLLWNNPIPNASAVLFKRAHFLKAGGAPANMRLAGDWMTWAKMTLGGGVSYIAEPLNCFRTHSHTVRSTTPNQRELRERWQVQSYLLQNGRVSRAQRKQLARHIVCRQFAESVSESNAFQLHHFIDNFRNFRAIWSRTPVESLRVLLFCVRRHRSILRSASRS